MAIRSLSPIMAIHLPNDILPITILIKVDPLPRWVLGPLQEVLPRAERNPPAKKIPVDTR